MEELDLLIDASPESLEMERDETGPPNYLKFESLSNKLRAHYRKRIGSPKPDLVPSPFPPEFINRLSVLLYLFTVLSTLKIGLFDVMPLVYEGRDDIVILQQCLVCFIFIEVMINWLSIRYVGSSYRDYISLYGDPLLHKQSLSERRLTQQMNTKYSSSAVLMPLVTQTGEVPELAGKRNGSVDAGADLKSHGIFINEKHDLAREAERVNQWMNRRNEQMNSKSIDDLICISEDDRTSLALSVKEQQNHSGAKPDLFDLMSPKPVIRRDGNTVTESYPYWSWVPCYACRRTRPPRCHHCTLCKTCVLKRDHHCFFAGSCVGYRNHRYFIVFLFWAWIGCFYATLHGFPYIELYIWPQISYFDVFFPVAAIRFMLGYVSFHAVLSVTTLTVLLVSDFFTVVYLYSQIRLIFLGLTSFERSCLKSSLEIKDTRRLSQKIRAVFGRYWLLNFVFPTHIFFEPEEDPVYWPQIQIFKH